MPDHRDPKLTKTDSNKDNAKWFGIAAAVVVVVVLLLLLVWLFVGFGGNKMAAAGSAVFEAMIAAG